MSIEDESRRVDELLASGDISEEEAARAKARLLEERRQERAQAQAEAGARASARGAAGGGLAARGPANWRYFLVRVILFRFLLRGSIWQT